MKCCTAGSGCTSPSRSSASFPLVSPRPLISSFIPFILTSHLVLIYIFLPDSPTKARWASEHEKKLLVERVRSNNQGLKQKHWNSGQALEAFIDPFTYCLFFLCFFNCLVVGGINTFSGLLITNAFGFSVSSYVGGRGAQELY